MLGGGGVKKDRDIITYHCHAVLPSSFFFPTDEIISVNGSSTAGNCSSVTPGTIAGGLSICNTPTSSVLFDGNIPTLTGLDGNMWASQLLTFQTSNRFRREILSEVTDLVRRVEFVIFNCPEWGISTQVIKLVVATSLAARARTLVQTFNVPPITSCDSLVRICISQNIIQPLIALEFIPPPGSNWTHLAEVTFYSTGTCPPDTIILSLATLTDAPGTIPVDVDFATPTTNNTILLSSKLINHSSRP